MNRHVRRICVYCGSGAGHNPLYADAARILGEAMAQAGVGLVYGGGGMGLMGEISRTVLHHGGHVTGIIPQFLVEKEKALHEVQDLVVTDNMHERKQLMFEKSDAFVALPGGIGTTEELVEQLTWTQLGQSNKPIVLADIDGFWQPLLALFKHMEEEAFIRKGLELRLTPVTRPEDILPMTLRLAAESEAGAEEATIAAKF